jgi:phage shock protein A
LNEAVGNQKEDIGVMLANVKNTLEKGRKQHEEHFRTLSNHCATANSKIQASIVKLTQATTDSQNTLNQWKSSIAQATKERKDATDNIKTAKGQLKAFQKRVDKLLLDYKVVAEEADQKLNVVKLLRDIITDELLNRSPGSFVQLSKFQQKLNELKGMLNNNNDSLYAPIVTVLLDLATEQNFSNQGVLKKILENLTSLNASLTNFRSKQEDGLKKEEKNLHGQMKNTMDRINAYSKMRAQATSKGLDANHYIKFYTHEITHFNAEKARKLEEQRMFGKLCDYEKNANKQDVKRFTQFKSLIVPHLFSQVQNLNSMK